MKCHIGMAMEEQLGILSCHVVEWVRRPFYGDSDRKVARANLLTTALMCS